MGLQLDGVHLHVLNEGLNDVMVFGDLVAESFIG